jgi:NitT/TauT family transport system substrate-binding protein
MKSSAIKLAWKIISVTCLVTFLTSCSALAPTPTPKQPLVVEFTQWWGDYTLIVAQQKGFFEKNGVSVKPVYYDQYSRALPDLAAGQIDAGLFAIGDAINVSRYTNVKVVAVYDNGGLNTIVSIPGLTKVADLAGKRVGVPVGSTYELLIDEILKTANLETSDIKLVNTNPEAVPTNLGKTIDAGFVYEPYTSKAVALGNNLLVKSDQFQGLFPDVIVFREAVVKEREADLRAFIKAWFEAVEYRQNNPEETRQLIADYQKLSLNEIDSNNQINLMTLADNIDIFQAQSQKFTPLAQTTKLNANFLVQLGVLSASPDISTLLDPSFFSK